MEKGYLDMELLRFTTAGSVDDGKSTLIGRLLYDSKSIFEDQLEAMKIASANRGNEELNLALLTDGLRAEREQGITIDVAYRYFATPKRKFIIADTPGHIEYTRNMVTGASTADLAIILVDARHGVLEQTVRHSYIASLLGIEHIVVCFNKMDLVDYSEIVFNEIKNDYEVMAQILEIHNCTFIPISAKLGDNVVKKSENMPWYKGDTLLNYLETVPIGYALTQKPFRFPVQHVIRPISDKFHDFRGYSGRIASGCIAVGDKVTVLPSKKTSEVSALYFAQEGLHEAIASQSISICLKDNIDVSRGNLIVKSDSVPSLSTDLEIMICWFREDCLELRKRYIIRLATQEVFGIVRSIDYKLDINSLEQIRGVNALQMNDIAKISLHVSEEIAVDTYQENRVTGSLIFIDPDSNDTVGAGMIVSIK
jgi:sulfate adenylyltransferase subunit 1